MTQCVCVRAYIKMTSEDSLTCHKTTVTLSLDRKYVCANCTHIKTNWKHQFNPHLSYFICSFRRSSSLSFFHFITLFDSLFDIFSYEIHGSFTHLLFLKSMFCDNISICLIHETKKKENILLVSNQSGTQNRYTLSLNKSGLWENVWKSCG